MENLISDNEPEISQNDPIEKPKRVMTDAHKEALKKGRQARADKLALTKINQKSIPEPILKKKDVKRRDIEVPEMATKPPKRKTKKQVIIFDDDSSEEDDDIPQIIIKRKSSKKADIPPPLPPPQVFEPEPIIIEEKPKYRMRRI